MANLPLPVPDEKQVRGFRRFFAEYVILALAVAVVFLFIQNRDLQMEMRAEYKDTLKENQKALQDFAQWQRFARPIRDEALLRGEPLDTSSMRQRYYKY